MTAIATGDTERFLRKPDGRFSVVLIYGDDHGLVVERGQAVAAAIVSDASDPMQIVRLDGDAVAADPLRLVDEANTMPMFGGKRAIRLRTGSKAIAPAIKPLIDTPPLDALVIIEAGALKKSDALVKLCTDAKTAAVIACYTDNARSLADIIDETVRAGGKSIDADARSLLQSLAGGDRIATRGEIEKLLLYTGNANRITIEDVEASVGDTANALIDSAIDGAFAGDLKLMMPALERLKAEGTDAGYLLGRALSHGWTLTRVITDMERTRGAPADFVKRISPFFGRKALVERQLNNWKPEALVKHIRTIGDAIQTARTSPALAEASVDRTFLSLSLAARRNR